jgi:hypothetical protein
MGTIGTTRPASRLRPILPSTRHNVAIKLGKPDQHAALDHEDIGVVVRDILGWISGHIPQRRTNQTFTRCVRTA